MHIFFFFANLNDVSYEIILKMNFSFYFDKEFPVVPVVDSDSASVPIDEDIAIDQDPPTDRSGIQTSSGKPGSGDIPTSTGNGVFMDKNDDRTASFFAQPGILAGKHQNFFMKMHTA